MSTLRDTGLNISFRVCNVTGPEIQHQEQEVYMIIAIIHFPPVKAGKEKEFLAWFEWSNREFAKLKGFVGRKLLKPKTGDAYTAIFELESYEDFLALGASDTHAEAGKRVSPLLDGRPSPDLYDVILA